MHARSFNPVGCLVVLGSIALGSCGPASSSEAGGSSAGGAASGGAAASGGSSMTGGGGTGFAPTGGTSSGGMTSAGGSPSGGATATGGSSEPTGGTTGTGGVTVAGGMTGMGGETASGGVTDGGGGIETGGTTATGGRVGRGGTTPMGGTTSVGGRGTTGGTTSVGGGRGTTGGTTSVGGGSGTTGGTTGGGNIDDRPCDIYAAASTPCVAAYSMVRALSKTYSGPLYQVRSGSSSQNTGTGGTTHDIGMTSDGYADVASQDAVCNGTTCTVSLLYDQSGNGNNLPVAKKGRSDGGQYGAMDDFESSATKGAVTAGGHKVYSLYMNAREGYRLQAKGKNMPLGTAPQGVYELADGTHVGTACCWDFGNVITDPTQYGVMNTLFFGNAFWGKGAGNGPWFMADFEAGVWAGGSKQGDPGWGSLDGAASSPANTNNPSLKVAFAFGILKTDPSKYALRMADAQTASDLTTAFEGGLPKAMNNLGGIVLGVGGDNSNNSWGTFYEGAITSGYPSDATDLAVFKNVQAVGYTK
jgi:hypothetical protein